MACRGFAAYLERAREHIRPWVGPTFVTDTVDGARATLRRYADASEVDGARMCGIWDDEILVGGVMFVSFDAAWGICEVGCLLEPGAEGRGVITRSGPTSRKLPTRARAPRKLRPRNH